MTFSDSARLRILTIKIASLDGDVRIKASDVPIMPLSVKKLQLQGPKHWKDGVSHMWFQIKIIPTCETNEKESNKVWISPANSGKTWNSRALLKAKKLPTLLTGWPSTSLEKCSLVWERGNPKDSRTSTLVQTNLVQLLSHLWEETRKSEVVESLQQEGS